jgi:glycosyltransferase involved in cell wall biosynthesis
VAVGQLLKRLPKGDFDQRLATIDAAVRDRFADELGVLGEPGDGGGMSVYARRLGLPALAGGAVRAHCVRDDVSLIHAWGIDAAAAARAAFPDSKPIAVSVFDPGLSDRDVRVLRAVGAETGFAVICAAERVQRRLVERGVPLERCATVRPGVDFAALASAAKSPIRAELGLPDNATVVVTPDPPASDGGHHAAVWSALMRWYLDPDFRIVVPGVSPALADLRRLAHASESPEIVLFTEHHCPFEHLIAAADFLVVATTAEISTTAIAWAMAAGTPIIAAATYATAEMLAHDLNGILFKAHEKWRRRAAKICGLYAATDAGKLQKIKEVARGQAYEVFSLRRTVEQHRQVYENLIAGAPPAKGVTDPAVVST